MWPCHTKVIPYFEVLRKSARFQWLLSSFSSYSDNPYKKPKLAPLQERKMIDRFRLWAKGGDGGNGCFSKHRSRCDRHGKPDGGNGGRGGDVILECSPVFWDFSSLQHHVNAKRGGHGASKNKIGSRGADKVVLVPVGTVIHLVEGETPDFVDNRPLTALDPWERPGAPVVYASESDHETDSNISSVPEIAEVKDTDRSVSHVQRNNKKSASTEQASQGLSNGCISKYPPLSRGSKVPMEEFLSYSEEATDDDMSEAGWEEVEEEEEIQYNIAELTEPGQKIVVARGGEGGLGNVSSAKVSKTHKLRSHDTYKDDARGLEVSEDGEQSSAGIGFPGSEAILILELKSIADVGLVGMPNAGKSTLLGAISKAKPAVGHYAFTTLRPNLGNLNYDDFFSVTVADIPGLIKGAHENHGLGHAFLRHIERTKVLAYVVDLVAALDGRKGIPPWEQLRDLVLELEHHQEGLSDRPSLVVANKIDEAGAEDMYEELKTRVQGVPIFPVCAVLEEGIPELKAGLRMLVDGRESQRLDLDRIIID